MSESVSLFCIVHGEQDATPFSIRVSGENTVDELKKFIKLEKQPEFDLIAADRLKLWKWNQPASASMVKDVDLDSSKVLNPMTKISNVFRDDSPKEECVHIIVKAPEPDK